MVELRKHSGNPVVVNFLSGSFFSTFPSFILQQLGLFLAKSSSFVNSCALSLRSFSMLSPSHYSSGSFAS